MDRKFVRGLAAGLIISFVASTFVIWLMVRDRKLNIPYGQNAMNAKMDQIQEHIENSYLGDYKLEDLYNGAYSGYVAGLGDRYSAYFSASDIENESNKNDEEDTVVGIGVYTEFNDSENRPIVARVIDGEAAYRAGVMNGDVIVTIDGEDTTGLSAGEADKRLNGTPGTEVALTLKREGEAQDVRITVKRRKVDEITVEQSILKNDIGYVKVTTFEAVTLYQFKIALEYLISKNVKSLIIDLRDNSGGLYDTAIDMTDCFLPKNQLAVYTIDKWGNKDSRYTADDDEISLPVAILLNKMSASSSEVFSGCLRDYDKAKIFGERSFGKGIMQTMYSLGDKDVIKLTTAYYYSPKGINIHGIGIEPDVAVTDDPFTANDEVIDAAIGYLKGN